MKEDNKNAPYKTMALPTRVYELDDDFDSSLEAFFSETRRKARDVFLHHGMLMATFNLLSERSDGRCLLTQVECYWDNNMEKAAVLAVVKNMINMKTEDGTYTVKSYTFAAEAWSSSSKDTKVRPSKDPNRIEVVSIVARERGRPDSLFAMAEIKRHALSSKPSLGEWVVTQKGESMLDMFDDDTVARTLH
jgi:hypothetical protein